MKRIPPPQPNLLQVKVRIKRASLGGKIWNSFSLKTQTYNQLGWALSSQEVGG
jgi:hypothetical protein